MPIPWLTVLQSVPWSDVISNAPKVADGAKKLWKTIGRKSPGQEMEASSQAAEPLSLAALQAQLLTVEAAVTDLHNQLLASSELIQALAEQNALLIARAEVIRIRLRWMLAAVAVTGIAAASALALLLGH
jgi:hypothetical protein